ncbi:MFS transporter, partial [Streptomyces sp. SID11233]|nr:MFS transporter [Streptomyces sp. SID11233]
MIGALMVTAQLSTNMLLPRIGPRPIVPVGLLMASGGLVWMTGLDLSSTYAANVLPPLILMGLGLGLVMPPAMSLATSRIAAKDAG